MERFEFDGCESAKCVLPASPVVGLFDPDNDGEAEFFAGLPAFAVQDVLLQQAEERLHGGVVGRHPSDRWKSECDSVGRIRRILLRCID